MGTKTYKIIQEGDTFFARQEPSEGSTVWNVVAGTFTKESAEKCKELLRKAILTKEIEIETIKL